MDKELTCPFPNHEEKAIIMICSNLECQTKSRLMCLRCLLELHKDCTKHVLEIENILKGDLSFNLNWLKDEEVQTAVKLINKYKLTNQVQVLETSEKRVEEEFGKLRDALNEELTKAKEMVIKNLRERQFNDVQINLKTFTKKMEEFYGFDTLVGIVESIKNNNQNDAETINLVLDGFFSSLNEKKKGDLDLETKGVALGKYLKDVIELDTSLFNKAKENLSLKLFENYLKSKPRWSWSTDFKAPGITLGQDNMHAAKTGNNGYVVVGTVEMNKGVHKWELDVSDKGGSYVCFGIVDKNIFSSWINNLDNFDYYQTIGFATDGDIFQMQRFNSPGEFNNKTYVCELDMDKGSFIIYCEGKLFLQHGVDESNNKASGGLFSKKKVAQQNLRGKTVIPYLYFCCVGDKTTLRVL